ncbi:MAG: hypothetical protein KKD31_01245 [Bacteroidetes bacterium]|nr:hypothetical protein [Bacteroidota bacterium]
MVDIGKMIQKVVREQKWKITDFADAVPTNRRNVYNIFRRRTIDTKLLTKIGHVLNHDFFQYYQSEGIELPIVEEERGSYGLKEQVRKLTEEKTILEIKVKELHKEVQYQNEIIQLLKDKIRKRK